MNILGMLAKSKFMSRFKLRVKELEYIKEKGLDKIRSHASDFIRDRVSPAEPVNDDKQTPMRGHSVFIAYHAQPADVDAQYKLIKAERAFLNKQVKTIERRIKKIEKVR